MTDPRVGDEFAGHRVVGVIGRGGMSVVYLAEHLGLRRKVALKVLGPELAEDEAFRERFIRESRIAAGLDHPNIVTVYDAGEADGVLFISMRYVQGTDLERLLRAETRLEPGRAVSLISQAAAALDAAHVAGLVHRDVKPGNILLASDPRSSSDRAFLSDFGVTKRLDTGAGITRTGQFVGTVDYVSPEQIKGGEVDGRADVYSLGCVLYRCLTGEVPFPRDTEVATIYANLQDDPPVPSERSPGLSVGFDAPIARALAKSPDDRFDTCRELAEAAGDVVDPPRPMVVRPDAVEADAGSIPQTPTPRRRIAYAVGLAVVAVVAVAIAAFLLVPRDDGPSPDPPSPTPTPGPLPQLTWTPVDGSGFVAPGDQEIADAAVVAGTIVAVGHDDTEGNLNAAVWTSTDARRWSRSSGTSLGTGGDQRMDAVATIGGDLVAAGSERIGGDVDPAVWRSADRGTTWIRMEGATTGLHEAGDQAMRVVVRAKPGVLAAGHDTSPEGDLDAAVWTSKDGSSWNRLTLSSLTGPGDQQIFGAATMGDRLITVGSSASPGGDLDAAVWVRADGRWTKVTDGSLGGPGDQQIEAVVPGAAGLVAVGWDASGDGVDAAVWTSTDDGSTWDRVSASDAVFGGTGDQQMSSVISVDGTYVAGGSSTRNGRDPNGAVWLSTDSIMWKKRTQANAVTGVGGQRISSLVSFAANRLVAAGSQDRGTDEQAAAWIAKLRLPSP